MESGPNTTQTWRFGVFKVDARNLELRRGGTPVKIREQSFRILIYLLEHAGEMVTREELRRVLWPADTFVDFDHSLNTAVMKLRDALGDSADTPLYIETIPKRGYRFIAPVSQAAGFGANRNDDAVSSLINSVTGTSEPQAVLAQAEKPVPHRRFERIWFDRIRGIVAVVGLLLLVAAGSFIFLRTRHGQASSADENKRTVLRIVPITTAAATRFPRPSRPTDARLLLSGTVRNGDATTFMCSCWARTCRSA